MVQEQRKNLQAQGVGRMVAQLGGDMQLMAYGVHILNWDGVPVGTG